MGLSKASRSAALEDSAGSRSQPPSTKSPTGPAVPGSRVGRTWVALAPAALAMVLVLLFVLQNLQATTVRFVVVSGRLPLGVALLVAAALGALVVFCLGSVRIVQLRHLAARRSAR
jgi:lipopolysaccharide assembly protein A